MDISLRDVTVSLQSSVLFRLKKLDVPYGSHIFIEGASGIGKSTLLHLIAGLFKPTLGSVQIGPHAFHEMRDSERSRIRRAHFAMVFQKLNLLEHLTAAENVRLGLASSNATSKVARSSGVAHRSEGDRGLEALKRVGLASRAHDRIGVMSLGEQQRIAVARVLAAKPAIVLADEPTSSLDAVNAELVIDSLLGVSKGEPLDSTVIVVSHDQRIRSRFNTVVQFKDLIS